MDSRIWQWNLNGARSRAWCLKSMCRARPLAVLLNEPHLDPDDPLDVPGYQCFRCDRPTVTKRSGGALILVRADIQVTRFQTDSTPLPLPSEWVAVHLALAANLPELVLVTGYRSPAAHSAPLDFLREYLSDSQHRGVPCIAAGDFNVDFHTIPTVETEFGAELRAAIDGHHLLPSRGPTRVTTETATTIDIWVANSFAMPLLHPLVQTYGQSGSDHRRTCILLQLPTLEPFPEPEPEPEALTAPLVRWDYRRANWLTFTLAVTV